jgi:excisionase family DNA binding protein
MPEPQKVLTVTELSDYLHVHRSTIYRLLKNGELPAFRIGSDWRFNVEEIDKWRAGKTIVPLRPRGAVD